VQGLHHIDLSENMIEHPHKLAFKPLQHIRTISVANNSIQKIRREFMESNYVRLINISHNKLTDVDPDTFYHVPRLEVLDLSYNNLKTLPWDNISQQLSSLEVLNLTGNPWNCSCEMKDILKLNRSLLNGSQAKCFDPPRLHGTLLEDLNSDTFSECYTEQYVENKHKLLGIIVALIFHLIFLSAWYCTKASKRKIVDKEKASLSERKIVNKEKPSLSEREIVNKEKAKKVKRKHRMRKKIDKQLEHSKSLKLLEQIWYDTDDRLDENGTVYKGGLIKDKRVAAIKIYRKIEVREELSIFLHLAEQARPHPNIIRYIWVEHNTGFTYLALELCEGNLTTAFTKFNRFDIVELQNYILQLTSAVSFLHEKNIQHRDIKPRNILWKNTNGKIALILSDFDLSKLSEEPSSHKVKCGTEGWSAPELWGQETRSTAVDIFSLGCVFHFILTGGHPFGEILHLKGCQDNIMSREYEPTFAELYEHHSAHQASMAEDLIRRMICSNAADRIQSQKIKEHPFLWSKMEMRNFFIRLGNYVKDKDNSNVSSFKKKLEEDASAVFDGNWLQKLHPVARRDVKDYEGDKICSLLQVIRNKIEHFEQIRNKELRKIYSRSADGVVEYYMERFPKLVPYTYRILEMSELEL
jgi:serine/threonine protein kinase